MGQTIAAPATSGHAASLAEAERQQALGSDPRVSAFVSASAGSGKTKLLTDRLLRLMLEGTPPERILCLTFTKAAAAEMALRLQKRLGRWASASDAELDQDLRALGFDPTEELWRSARALFAHVLDLPGGMRIETIHAFCESLLRRFPLKRRFLRIFRFWRRPTRGRLCAARMRRRWRRTQPRPRTWPRFLSSPLWCGRKSSATWCRCFTRHARKSRGF